MTIQRVNDSFSENSTDIQKMNLYTDLIPSTKINSKWIVDLKVKHKAIKFLESNTGKNLDLLSFGNDVFSFAMLHSLQDLRSPTRD